MRVTANRSACATSLQGVARAQLRPVLRIARKSRTALRVVSESPIVSSARGRAWSAGGWFAQLAQRSGKERTSTRGTCALKGEGTDSGAGDGRGDGGAALRVQEAGCRLQHRRGMPAAVVTLAGCSDWTQWQHSQTQVEDYGHGKTRFNAPVSRTAGSGRTGGAQAAEPSCWRVRVARRVLRTSPTTYPLTSCRVASSCLFTAVTSCCTLLCCINAQVFNRTRWSYHQDTGRYQRHLQSIFRCGGRGGAQTKPKPTETSGVQAEALVASYNTYGMGAEASWSGGASGAGDKCRRLGGGVQG